ncbi:MAG: 50S ribosomal protein L11 methyltransferase [Campylobacter sp.]|nr:50S ribosomal protein L11 methyltransferase [Campylobacter sp.]
MKDKFYELTVLTRDTQPFKDFVFDMGVECIEEIDGGFVVRDEESLENLEFGLNEYKNALNSNFKINLNLTTNLVVKENRDWINEYKKGVTSIEVGKFYIHPSWLAPKSGLINIAIDPALAFGSGHHESTNSCLNLISKYASGAKSALDVGCGSGILSIALAKLSISVDSCDTDIQAIEATTKNSKLNSVKLNKIWLGSVDRAVKQYDIVVANIIADIIIILQKDLKKYVKNGGLLVLSGILDKYLDKILEIFGEFEVVEILPKNEWVSLVLKNKEEI